MKLELKHLAPYLPHRINCYGRGEVVEETQYSANPISKLLTITGLNPSWVTVEGIRLTMDEGILIEDCIPILRPLSDLTKRDWDKIFTTDDIDDILTIFQSDKSMDCVEYYLVNILLSYHFDIFGLVEEGLALDINTISK